MQEFIGLLGPDGWQCIGLDNVDYLKEVKGAENRVELIRKDGTRTVFYHSMTDILNIVQAKGCV